MSAMRSHWSGKKQINSAFHLKRQISITKQASHSIEQCVLEANDNYEVGGVLLGYNWGRIYFIVAVTTPNKNENSSRVSFLLDGIEHSRKVSDIMSSFACPPSVLGIWHSHICDGLRFSEQDKTSNKILAKSLGGALSMLVIDHANVVAFSTYYISTTGVETRCRTTVCSRIKGR